MSDPSEGQTLPHSQSHQHHQHHDHNHPEEQDGEQEQEREHQHQHQHQHHQQQQHQDQQQQQEPGHHHQPTSGQEQNEERHPQHDRSREPTADLDQPADQGSAEPHQEQTALWGVPDQLAKILEAARGATNNVKSHASTNAQPTEEEQRSMYEQARQVFARMPHLPNHDAAAHALDRYSSRSTENGAGVDSASEEAQGEGADPTHTTSMILAEHQGGQSSQSMRHPPSNDRQQQYLPHHHKVATAAAITAMDDLSAHGHDGDVAALSERTRGYGSPERRSIRSHTDELGDEDNAHASGSSGRARSRKGKAAAVGGPETPETERQRKDLHKEVERKRRAGINSAIGELQSLVPDCNDKGVNKGDIILRAAAYIRELKNSEASNIEKWTLEKLLMDQALHDGQVQLEATRAEVERLREALGKEAESIPGTEEIVRDWGSHNHHSSTAEQHQSQRDAGQGSEVEHEEQQAPPVTLKAHGDGGNASSSTSDTITTAAIAPREGNSSAEDEAVRTAMIDNVDAVRLAAAVATVGPMGGGTGIAQTHLPSATDEEPLRTQVSPLIGERERVSSGSEEGNIFEESESNALEHTLGQLTGKRDHDDESVGQNAKVQKLTHLRDGEEIKPGA